VSPRRRRRSSHSSNRSRRRQHHGLRGRRRRRRARQTRARNHRADGRRTCHRRRAAHRLGSNILDIPIPALLLPLTAAIDAHRRPPATDRAVVARALVVAVAHDAVLGRVPGIELIRAETLAAVFQPGVRQVARAAEGNARLDRHVVGARGGVEKSAVADVIAAAACIAPFERRREVEEVLAACAEGGCVVASFLCSAGGAEGRGVAAGQFGEVAVNGFFDGRRDAAGLRLGARELREDGAFLDAA